MYMHLQYFMILLTQLHEQKKMHVVLTDKYRVLFFSPITVVSEGDFIALKREKMSTALLGDLSWQEFILQFLVFTKIIVHILQCCIFMKC